MNKKIIQVRLSEVEADHLDQITERLGCSLSEFIRRLIDAKYEKMFPAYMGGKKTPTPKIIQEPEPKLTPEQQCEAHGGRVMRSEDNGRLVCFIQAPNCDPGSGSEIPLTDEMFNE